MRRLNLNNIHRYRIDVFDPEFSEHMRVIDGRHYYPDGEDYDGDFENRYWQPSPWITSYDEQTGSELLCALCKLPAERQWINWQKCWCTPCPRTGRNETYGPYWDGMYINVVRNIGLKCPETDEFHDDELDAWDNRQNDFQVLRMQSRAIYRDPDLGPTAEPVRFWWFFICQQCREETKASKLHGIPQLPAADPKRSRFFWDFEKHEIRNKEARAHSSDDGHFAMPTLYEVSPESTPLYEHRMNHHMGVGSYWSPPASPRASIEPYNLWQNEDVRGGSDQNPEVTQAQNTTSDPWSSLIRAMRRDFHREKDMDTPNLEVPPSERGFTA
jgi:hypothetical protein